MAVSPTRRILFMTNSELGQATVHLATAHELLLQPNAEVHFASFPALESAIASVNAKAPTFSRTGKANHLNFHPLQGKSMIQASGRDKEFLEMHRPGFSGALYAYRNVFPTVFATWSGPEYMEVYRSCLAIIKDVQPDLVAIDPMLTQASDACRVTETRYIILSPMSFKDHAFGDQPGTALIGKYPLTGTGWAYPLSWYLIPLNIICLFSLLRFPKHAHAMQAFMKYRQEAGLPGKPRYFYMGYPEDLPVLVPATAGQTDYPFKVPQNYSSTGPILLPTQPLKVIDPALEAWLARAPTILINLGSHVLFDEELASEFAKAIHNLLTVNSDMQVLWKLKSKPESSIRSSFNSRTGPFSIISQEMEHDRVRITDWLAAEPIAILSSGHVAAVVHHGGANSYYEAVAAGVPQVVLPVWADTYDYADRVEWLGTGLWGNRKAAPRAEAVELEMSMARIVSSSDADGFKRRARELAAETGVDKGRRRAAERVLELCAEGRTTKAGEDETEKLLQKL